MLVMNAGPDRNQMKWLNLLSTSNLLNLTVKQIRSRKMHLKSNKTRSSCSRECENRMCVCCHTWVKPTVVTLVVPVLPAAGSLLQAWAGLSTVTGLLLYVTNTHSHRRLAGFGTATPKAPVVHNAVLSWVLVSVEGGWGALLQDILCSTKQSNCHESWM